MPAFDPFNNSDTGYSAARDMVAITPSNTEFNVMPKWIEADTAGTVTFVTASGTTVTRNVVAGQVIYCRVTKVTAATAAMFAAY